MQTESETHDVSTQEEGQDHAGSLEAPSAKRLKTQFRCSKCGFTTDDSTQFQQHIPQHKTDGNTRQCLHCGLCFTSVLSLSRHLFIVHKVKGSEEEKKKKKEVPGVVEKELDNEPAKSAKADEVNDWLPELKRTELPQAEEPTNLHCAVTTDCNLKQSAHSQTQSVSLC